MTTSHVNSKPVLRPATLIGWKYRSKLKTRDGREFENVTFADFAVRYPSGAIYRHSKWMHAESLASGIDGPLYFDSKTGSFCGIGSKWMVTLQSKNGSSVKYVHRMFAAGNVKANFPREEEFKDRDRKRKIDTESYSREEDEELTEEQLTDSDERAERRRQRRLKDNAYRRKYDKKQNREKRRERLIIGIDGEGLGNRPHRYTYLAAVGDDGVLYAEARNPEGLSSVECLELLLSLPKKADIFGFSLGYDRTKWLSDLPTDSLWAITHPEDQEHDQALDRSVTTYKPNEDYVIRKIWWKDYSLELRGTGCLKIGRWNNPLNQFKKNPPVSGKAANRVIWDIWKYYGASFIRALEDWKIGTPAQRERIREMKEKRAEFENLPTKKIEEYCKEECQLLALLGKALVHAHLDIDLPQRSFYSPGNSAKLFLKREKITEEFVDPKIVPKEMEGPIACAFFGGRFENRVVGIIKGPIYGYDINSAYPYAAYHLPCLKHGRWTFIKRNVEAAIATSRLALIHWLNPDRNNTSDQEWGVLPVRRKEGTIIFPTSTRFGGWTWKQEFLSARKLAPDLIAKQAWVYNTDCVCHPFAQIPELYKNRLRLGKEGVGITIKLIINSVYGVLVQSVGRAEHQNWIWGSNITSFVRAMILDAIFLAPCTADVLAVATDGILSKSPLVLPAPTETGTDNLPYLKKQKPLGAWDSKLIERDIFIARPGVHFPMNPTKEDYEQVRGRGIGRKHLYNEWQRIVDGWQKGETEFHFSVRQFVGIKGGLSKGANSGIKRSENYGEWILKEGDMSLSPWPKRMWEDKGVLIAWPKAKEESYPYDPAVLSPEARSLKEAQELSSEQPDGYDPADFDGGGA